VVPPAPPFRETFLSTVVDPLKRDRWARLRFSIIGPLLAAPPAAGELRTALASIAAKAWRHPTTGLDVRFGTSTLERWYYAARRAVDPVAVYPLRRGEQLMGLQYFALHHHRLLGSRWLSRTRQEHWGAALVLWARSVGSQDPAGTLPDDDDELARLAEYGRDVAAWRAVREGALWGWVRVMVLDADGAECGLRLAHPVMTSVVERLVGEAERAASRTGDALMRQNFGRLRRALSAELGREAQAAEVRAMELWLLERGERRSRAAVAQALREGALRMLTVTRDRS
jgi:hypothetical protein